MKVGWVCETHSERRHWFPGGKLPRRPQHHSSAWVLLPFFLPARSSVWNGHLDIYICWIFIINFILYSVILTAHDSSQEIKCKELAHMLKGADMSCICKAGGSLCTDLGLGDVTSSSWLLPWSSGSGSQACGPGSAWSCLLPSPEPCSAHSQCSGNIWPMGNLFLSGSILGVGGRQKNSWLVQQNQKG